MGQVSFSTVFSGGKGNLVITCNDPAQVLNFTEADTDAQSLTLAAGHQILSIKGAAPDGAGGNIALTITGDIPAEIDQNFPSGLIPTHSLILYLTQ